MKNWKSSIAFLLFMSAYRYSLYSDKSGAIVDTTGYLALFAMLFVMMRNEVLEQVVKDLAGGFKNRISKG